MYVKWGQQCLRFLCAAWLFSNVFVLVERSSASVYRGSVQPMQNRAVGQYPLHRCTQTAAEQLFLITEQSTFPPQQIYLRVRKVVSSSTSRPNKLQGRRSSHKLKAFRCAPHPHPLKAAHTSSSCT